MGDVAANAVPTARAVELPLPWGQTMRGLRWLGAGPPILLLHAPGTDLDAWGALPATLAAALHADVFAYDLPGHGLSDDPWEPETLPDIIRQAARHVAAGRPLAIVAAGQSANVALTVASGVPLLGNVGLSPGVPDSPPRSPTTPKLFFAGAQATDDLTNARGLASSCGGWSLVTSIPTNARGTELLATDWSSRITQQIVVFLRDCLRQHSRSLTPLSQPGAGYRAPSGCDVA